MACSKVNLWMELGVSQMIHASILKLSFSQAQDDVVETNAMLDSLGSTVADLKAMAHRMGDELEVQNERLDCLKKASDETEVRLKATNVKVKKQL